MKYFFCLPSSSYGSLCTVNDIDYNYNSTDVADDDDAVNGAQQSLQQLS